jgi:hypothetical protein
MTLIGRRFSLSTERGCGVFCSENGLFIGEVPMLERTRRSDGALEWRTRPALDLNRDLSARYGLPIEISSKIERLAAIAKALNRGDLVYALIATPHLEFPDPPDLTKSALRDGSVVGLSRSLQASGLLKADWDPSKHPRWPTGSAGGIGGEFAPAGGTDGASSSAEPDPSSEVAQVIPARLDTPDGIPFTPANATTLPFPRVLPGEIPLPSEIAPGPLLPPNVNPIHIPRNPYPGRPKCVKEWAQAQEDCVNLWANGLLGTDDYRGMGSTIAECMMGRVSQDCGGNRYDA